MKIGKDDRLNSIKGLVDNTGEMKMNGIRIVHTADNHIGLKFKGRHYGQEVREKLIQERLDALHRIVAVANERQAHFLVVAGDLFDSVNVSLKEIKGAADILKSFTGANVVVLPGNHDFFEAGNDQLWGRFRGYFGDHLLLLDRQEPVDVEVEERKIVFFPGPCTTKHSKENAIGWVAGAAKDSTSLNIGIAHGSIKGISPDFDATYYPMTAEQLKASGVAFWLTGHTHIRYPDPGVQSADGSLFYIPSTHTPDGFDCSHEGYAWFLEADAERKVTAETIRTGNVRFYDMQKSLSTTADLDSLKAELDKLEAAKSLLKLELTGRLSETDRSLLPAFREELQKKFAYFEVDVSGVALHVTPEFIDKTYAKDSLPHRLLSRLAGKPEDSLALQLAYEMITEARA